MDFIKGGSSSSVKVLTEKMEQAAENLEFELAARLRDRINAIQAMKERQKVVASRVEEQDVFALAQGETHTAFEVFRFTGNKLSDRESFLTEGCQPDPEARSEFLRQYYAIRDRVPPLVVLDGEVEDQELLTRWLTEKRGKAVKVLIPQRGDQRQLVDMCRQNAAEHIARHTGTSGRDASALDELRRLLGLEKAPAYIESYDISNLAGGENVAGMVVFENGRPLKSAYRKFKINRRGPGRLRLHAGGHPPPVRGVQGQPAQGRAGGLWPPAGFDPAGRRQGPRGGGAAHFGRNGL